MTLTDSDSVRQYNKLFKFKSLGGFMRMRKILQAEQHESRTVVLIPGWGESFTVMRRVAVAMAANGYNVIVLDYQYLDDLSAINGNFDDIPDSIPKNEYAKAFALVGFLVESKGKDINIVAHSEGAIIGTLSAYIKPDLFKSLVLVNPAGFIKESTFGGLSAKLVYSIYKQDVRNFGRYLRLQLSYFKEMLFIVFKNPMQSFRDGIKMAKYNILDQVSDVSDSVQVDLVFNKVDALFPLEDLVKASENLKVNHTHVMEGGHNEMYIHTSEFVELIDDIIR